MPRQADRLAAVVDRARSDGVPVGAEHGWRTHGYRSFAPRGFTIHHDASPRGSSARHIVRDGRAGLSGPLAHLYLERDGTLVVIAAGRANHAGRGGWRGLSGNRSVWGLEIANDGTGEPYSDAQMHAVIALCRAFVDVDGIPVELIHAHHEWAPTRKIDPSVDWQTHAGQWRMDALRLRVRQRPDPEQEDDEMQRIDVIETEQGVYLLDHPYAIKVPDPDTGQYYLDLAGSEANTQYRGPYKWDESRVAKHPRRSFQAA